MFAKLNTIFKILTISIFQIESGNEKSTGELNCEVYIVVRFAHVPRRARIDKGPRNTVTQIRPLSRGYGHFLVADFGIF